MKEVLYSLRAKNLLNSNDIEESEENRIPNLPTVDVVHIKPVESDKDVQASNLNSYQQASQGIVSNPSHQPELDHLLSQFILQPQLG